MEDRYLKALDKATLNVFAMSDEELVDQAKQANLITNVFNLEVLRERLIDQLAQDYYAESFDNYYSDHD